MVLIFSNCPTVSDENPIKCTFEDDVDFPEEIRTENCKFDHDNSMSENWVITSGEDNTYNTGNTALVTILIVKICQTDMHYHNGYLKT